jgi:hypothetical protein
MAQLAHSSFLPHVRQSTTGEAVFDFSGQLARDDLLVASLLKLQAHVDDFNFGQRPFFDAVG